ncbi:MAG: hypothetical protein HC769_31590 [Cyanobacteria bacterium CRU_2_1]|nr:hypothetical protein [Cyanobacteria bacterium CRU_2_1]
MTYHYKDLKWVLYGEQLEALTKHDKLILMLWLLSRLIEDEDGITRETKLSLESATGRGSGLWRFRLAYAGISVG